MQPENDGAHGANPHNPPDPMEAEEQQPIPVVPPAEEPPLGRWCGAAVGEIYELKLEQQNGQAVKDRSGNQVVFTMKRETNGALKSTVPDWKFSTKVGGDSLYHAMKAAMGPDGREARDRLIAGKGYHPPRGMTSFFSKRPPGAGSSSSAASPMAASPVAASQISHPLQPASGTVRMQSTRQNLNRYDRDLGETIDAIYYTYRVPASLYDLSM